MKLAALGRSSIGIAMIALGIQSLWLRIYVGRLQPVPDWVPGRATIAVLTGIFLIAVGIGILKAKWARLAATALAGMLLLWVAVLYLPLVFSRPGAWLGAFETFALFGASALCASALLVAGTTVSTVKASSPAVQLQGKLD
jgi:hypothetical protein